MITSLTPLVSKSVSFHQESNLINFLSNGTKYGDVCGGTSLQPGGEGIYLFILHFFYTVTNKYEKTNEKNKYNGRTLLICWCYLRLLSFH